MRMVVRADSAEELGEAMIAVWEHARDTADEFSVGPMNQERLLADGLQVDGEFDPEVLEIRVREAAPQSRISIDGS